MASDINDQYICVLDPCVVKLKYKSECEDAIAAIKTFRSNAQSRTEAAAAAAHVSVCVYLFDSRRRMYAR